MKTHVKSFPFSKALIVLMLCHKLTWISHLAIEDGYHRNGFCVAWCCKEYIETCFLGKPLRKTHPMWPSPYYVDAVPYIDMDFHLAIEDGYRRKCWRTMYARTCTSLWQMITALDPCKSPIFRIEELWICSCNKTTYWPKWDRHFDVTPETGRSNDNPCFE